MMMIILIIVQYKNYKNFPASHFAKDYNNNNNNNHNYKKVIPKVRQDDMCRICQSQSETIDYLISGCPILAKHEFLETHKKKFVNISTEWNGWTS